MAPVDNKKTTSILILLGIVALGFAAGYLYNTQFSQSQLPTSSQNIPLSDDLSKFKDLNLDFSAFNNDSFKTLRIFGDSPVLPGSSGRADIFAPIQ